MKKSDLKDGMIVELKDGSMCVKIGDKLLDNDDYIYLSGYNDDLEYEFDYLELDIVSVYNGKNLCGLNDRYDNKEDLCVLWIRDRNGKPRDVSYEDIYIEYEKFCDKQGEYCEKCKYINTSDCTMAYMLEHYNVTKK